MQKMKQFVGSWRLWLCLIGVGLLTGCTTTGYYGYAEPGWDYAYGPNYYDYYYAPGYYDYSPGYYGYYGGVWGPGSFAFRHPLHHGEFRHDFDRRLQGGFHGGGSFAHRGGGFAFRSPGRASHQGGGGFAHGGGGFSHGGSFGGRNGHAGGHHD